jgi:hypothetical protein
MKYLVKMSTGQLPIVKTITADNYMVSSDGLIIFRHGRDSVFVVGIYNLISIEDGDL